MTNPSAESQSSLSGTAEIKRLLDATMKAFGEDSGVEFYPLEMPRYRAARLALEEYVERLRGERLLMAMLASDKPQFDNPLVAWHAQSLRDKLLEELSGRSTESGVPK